MKIFPILISPSSFSRVKFKFPDPKLGPKEFKLSELQSSNPPSKTLVELREGEQNRVLHNVADQLAGLPRGAPAELANDSDLDGRSFISGSVDDLECAGQHGPSLSQGCAMSIRLTQHRGVRPDGPRAAQRSGSGAPGRRSHSKTTLIGVACTPGLAVLDDIVDVCPQLFGVTVPVTVHLPVGTFQLSIVRGAPLSHRKVSIR